MLWNLYSVSLSQAIPVSLIPIPVPDESPCSSLKVSLKKLLATSPHGFAGEPGGKEPPFTVEELPKSSIVTIGEQSELSAETDKASPLS